MSDSPTNTIKYKLAQLRNRFYDMGDDYGVTMCHNLAEDLQIEISEGGSSENNQSEEDQ